MVQERSSLRNVFLLTLCGLSSLSEAAKLPFLQGRDPRAHLEKKCNTVIVPDKEPVIVSRCDQQLTISSSRGYATARADCKKRGLCSVVPGAAPVSVTGPTKIVSRYPVETVVLQKFEDWDKYETQWLHSRKNKSGKKPLGPRPDQSPKSPLVSKRKCWSCCKIPGIKYCGEMCCNETIQKALKQPYMIPFPTYTVTTTVTTYDLPTYTIDLDVSVVVESASQVTETITSTSYYTETLYGTTTVVVEEDGTGAISTVSQTDLPQQTDVPEQNSPPFRLSFQLPPDFLPKRSFKKRQDVSSSRTAYLILDSFGNVTITSDASQAQTLWINGESKLETNFTNGEPWVAALQPELWLPYSISKFIFVDAAKVPSVNNHDLMLWFSLVPAGYNSVSRAILINAGSEGRQATLCATNATEEVTLYFAYDGIPGGACMNIAMVADIVDVTGGGGEEPEPTQQPTPQPTPQITQPPVMTPTPTDAEGEGEPSVINTTPVISTYTSLPTSGSGCYNYVAEYPPLAFDMTAEALAYQLSANAQIGAPQIPTFLEACQEICKIYPYLGIYNGSKCYCGYGVTLITKNNADGSQIVSGNQLPDAQCDLMCTVSGECMGGANAMSIYYGEIRYGTCDGTPSNCPPLDDDEEDDTPEPEDTDTPTPTETSSPEETVVQG